MEHVEKEVMVQRSRVLYLESVMEEPEFLEHMQWRDKLPSLPSWPSSRKGKKHAQTDANDIPVPKRKCSTRSWVGHIFTSAATAALIKDAFLE